ncbi:MAG: hypothetical protein VW127_02095 [Flavobacteriaceae bacterium]
MNAQFNYQAIVKDTDGNVLSNNQVKLKFSLILDSSDNTPVYVEEHTVTTPSDGVINISVGGGTVLDGVFTDVDWKRGVFIKEEMDLGSGYEDMGTKQFASVPLAEYAKEIDNISFYGTQNMHIGLGEKIFSELVSNTTSIGPSSGVFSTGSDNVFLGRLAGMQINGNENVGIGNNSMIGGFDVLPESANNNQVSNFNTAIGFNSLKSIDGGDYNTAMGWNSLNSNTSGYNNIAIGTDALSSNVSGTDNLAIGNGALFQNLAQRNLAVGASSLENNTSGTINTAVGFQSMQLNQTGGSNTALGDSSLYSNTTGEFNVAVGRSSLADNIDGDGNTAIGDSSGYRNESGSFNTSLGIMSFFSLESGDDNVAVGAYSGAGTTGEVNSFSQTTLVGAYSHGIDGVQNSTAIGANSIVTTSNTIQLGNTDVSLINTSGVVSATDFILSGDSVGDILVSIADLQSELVSLDSQVAALLAEVDGLNSTSGNFLDSDDNKFSVWFELSSDGNSDDDEVFFVINSVSSATFIDVINVASDNSSSCMTLPNLDQMLNGEVNHIIEGENYLISAVESSYDNFTVKFNSTTEFDENQDGVGWLKWSFTKINNDLIRFDTFQSDDFLTHKSSTLQRVSNDYPNIYAELIQYCD